MACDQDFNIDNIYPDLIVNYAKLSRLFEVLTVFSITADEKKKIENLGFLMSGDSGRTSFGGEKEMGSE